jgi:hypothetical protein
LGVSVQNFTQLGGGADSYILLLGVTQFCNESDKGSVHQILCTYLRKYDRDPGNDQTSVQGRKHKPYMESPNTPTPKKGEMGEEQSQEHAHNLL